MALDQLQARPITAADATNIPEALHVSSNERPFADDFGMEGVSLQLLHADVEASTFAVRIKFAPGIQLPPHHHTGLVYAYTLAGEWYYLEYQDKTRNREGSYMYEPPGSLHTLKIADDNEGITDVIFVVQGAMLILDDEGRVIQVLDAASHIRDWSEALKEQGKAVPEIIMGGQVGISTPGA